MWKFSASSGVSGTPTAFVNGVMLEEFPGSADDWKDLFNSLYPKSESQ